MRKMKRVTIGRAEVIHVETRLGIVNIYLGLTDSEERRVERVEMLPDRYADGKRVTVDGKALGVAARFIEESKS